MTALEQLIQEAEGEATLERRWADLDHRTHMYVGVLAVVAGVVAGIAASAEWAKAIIAAAGFAAAILAGIQTFARKEDRSRFHYKKFAELKRVAHEGLILRERGEPPSEDELRRLADRLEALQGEIFDGETAGP
jgi:hypothetical protein